jgi:hypothetical protein
MGGVLSYSPSLSLPLPLPLPLPWQRLTIEPERSALDVDEEAGMGRVVELRARRGERGRSWRATIRTERPAVEHPPSRRK